MTTNTWDSWGELNTRTWPGGLQESFQYGDRGMTNATDRLSIATRFARDTLGRSVRQVEGASNAVSYAFLSNGVNQLLHLWDGNSNRTAWAYDEFGNPTNKLYADNSQERYQFDRLNRLTNKVDAANVSTRYGYDANGNLTVYQAGGNPQVTFAYDLLNRRTNMADGVGSTRWTYDALDRPTSESGPFGTTVGMGYDALGRLTGFSFGGYAWVYRHDALGRITNVTATEGSYRLGYLGQGLRKASIAYPNGVVADMTHDALLRLTNLVYAVGASNVLSIRYGYDNGDRRTNEVWGDGRSVGYAYDGAHQLVDALSTSRASDRASYRYDKAGNPLRRTELGLGITNSFNNLNQLVAGVWTGGTITVAGSVNYNAGTVTVNGVTANRFGLMYERTNVSLSAGTNTITAVYYGPLFTNAGHIATSTVTAVVGTAAYGHDANGNLTNDATFVYLYDSMNRLTSVVNRASGSTVLSSRYDGLGRRVEVTRDGTNTERYVYLPGSFLVVAVLDATNGVKEVYTHGPDLSGALGSAGGIGGILAVVNHQPSPINHFFHSDANGNVVAATSSSGTLVAAYQYTPFGKVIARTGSIDLRYQFSSKEYDPQAGLVYYGYRSYSPALGRWMNRDPLAETGGLNLYGFLKNSSVNALDYLGLKACAVYVWVGHKSTPYFGIEAKISQYKGKRDSDCFKHAAYGCNLSRFLSFTEKYIVAGHPHIDVPVGGEDRFLNRSGNWYLMPPYDTSDLVQTYRQPGMSWEDFSAAVLRSVLSAASSAAVQMAVDLSRDQRLRCKCDCDEVKLEIKKVVFSGFTEKEKVQLKAYSDQSWKVMPQ